MLTPYPISGDKHVDKLTAETLRNWHRDLAKAPRRIRTKKARQNIQTRPIDLTTRKSLGAARYQPIAFLVC